MAGVQLHAVDPGAPAPVGRGGELLHDRREILVVRDAVLDARGRRRVGRGEAGELRVGEHHRQAIGTGTRRDRGHEHRATACDVEAGERTVVRELRSDGRAVRMDPIGERPQTRFVGVEGRAHLAFVHAAVGIRNRDRADEQERGAARARASKYASWASETVPSGLASESPIGAMRIRFRSARVPIAPGASRCANPVTSAS